MATISYGDYSTTGSLEMTISAIPTEQFPALLAAVNTSMGFPVEVKEKASGKEDLVTAEPLLFSELKSATQSLMAGGRKIAAIKLVRAATKWGLKEAKDWVDALPPSSW